MKRYGDGICSPPLATPSLFYLAGSGGLHNRAHRSPHHPQVSNPRLPFSLTPSRNDHSLAQVVTLQRTTKRQHERNGVEGNKDLCCTELVLVKEVGVCVPKEGSMWGLSPRVVVGDTGTGLGRGQPRWDGLMPSISGRAGQGMLVNLGHSPFRHSADGYLPVSEMAHADARFILQVYDDASKMWQDVRPG